jgi:hypothetical protein
MRAWESLPWNANISIMSLVLFSASIHAFHFPPLMHLLYLALITMSCYLQDRYVQGDEYLPEMRLHHKHSRHYSVTQPDDLARDLSRLSTRVDSTPHHPRRSGENNFLLQRNRLSQHANSNAGSSTSKGKSQETPASSSTRSSSNSSRASSRSTDNDRWRQPSTPPSQFMLDRWLAETTRQIPFHGLVRTTDHRDRSERCSQSQRAHRD